MNQNYAIPIPPQQQQQQQQHIQGNGPALEQTQNQQPKPEDDDGANGGTTSIDTFQEYKPTALPREVVRACNEWYASRSTRSSNSTWNVDLESSRNSNSNFDNCSTRKEEANSGGETLTSNVSNSNSNTNSDPTKSQTTQHQIKTSVIDLTETDAEADNTEARREQTQSVAGSNDSSTPKAPTPLELSTFPLLPLEVPSHTSTACESALLSSVSAPMVPEETAECLLPLLLTKQNQTQKQNQDDEQQTRPPLSPLQLEGVLLAIQKHRRVHHSSSAAAAAPNAISTNNTNNANANTYTNTNGSFRAGFFLGDGAGIGKGRQISAILRDGFGRGRKRHVWLSVSRELIKDAQRDLRDVGLHCADDFVHDGTRFLGEGISPNQKGILFLTYNLLISANRIEQIIAWCAGTEHMKHSSDKTKTQQLEQSFDGCIVFDEAHKAKNLANNTKTAQLVLMLQRRLPMARVVYCSATGVSEIDQLAYAERLGLWKLNQQNENESPTSHEIPESSSSDGFSNFSAFRSSLEKRGLGSLELLALELKTRGSFMARTLSWEGAEFETAEIPLDQEQRLVYDRSVAWWNKCKKDMGDAFKILTNVPNSGSSNAGVVWGIFWAAHQRYFKELAICAKVPFLAKDARKHIEEKGCCVVFGLQGTGEAGMQSILKLHESGCHGKKKNNPRLLPNDSPVFSALVSTVSACLTNFVKQHFPVAPFPPDLPLMPKQSPTNDEERRRYAAIRAEIDRIRALPPPAPIPSLVGKQKLLLEAVRDMNLPPNPLDDLIDRLGGPNFVAEMTGRNGRIVRDTKKQQLFVYSKRVVDSDTKKKNPLNRGEDSDRINLIERRLFMDGSKSVAIISDAASTGVSLHAASGSGASHKRRVHYTIELPWSADKAVQQLGRSHRSGQESAPIYKLVVTNLGGERRFAAAVSKRLASLGALTKGDRRAATGSDMSEFDLDSKYGKRALKRFYNALEENEASGGESSVGVLGVLSSESGKAKAIIEEFINDSKVAGDPIVHSLPSDDEKLKNACVLSIAIAELERVGLDKSARSKADVRVFLNRLSGLVVSRQALVFSLFMSTLGGIMSIATKSGEFEGTAEDVTATTIEIDHEANLGVDPSSGAQTKLTTLVLDRGIPFETVRALAIEEAQKSTFAVTQCNNGENNTALTKMEDEKGFIVIDDDDGRDTKRRIAESGFYVSKNKISGRNLVLFAKRKFNPSKFKTEDEQVAIDPLGLMQISRPNTGLNLTDKSTRDLRHAYRIFLSCDKINELSSEQQAPLEDSMKENKNPQYYIKMSKKIASLWKLAFEESDSFNHRNGLAPRRQRVSLVNGPVLHILPALESVVRFRSDKEKALKIMRAQVGSRRIVGVRFPSDTEALEKLLAELDTIQKARRNAGKTFTDEALMPICPKTMSWATTKRKTMKSFFKVTSSNSAATAIKSIAKLPAANAGKKRSSLAPLSHGNSVKKPKASNTTMMSYFKKKK